MKKHRLATLAAASVALSLTLVGCGEQSAPSAAVPATAEPAAAPVPAPPQPSPLGGTNTWQIAGPGTATGQGASGKASIDGKAYLAVVAEKAPVTAGDEIVVKGQLTAPVGRPVRLIIMRHCDQANGDDLATADVTGTGEPTDFEVSHTFAASYGCVRLSVVPGDKAKVDVELSNLQFLKMPKP